MYRVLFSLCLRGFDDTWYGVLVGYNHYATYFETVTETVASYRCHGIICTTIHGLVKLNERCFGNRYTVEINTHKNRIIFKA